MQFHYDARSSDNSRLSDAEILEAATDLVDNLSLLIEELLLGDDILDETLLPASRQTFEAAFRLAIATTGQSGRRRRLIEIGHLLAQFQPDVGSRISLSPLPLALDGKKQMRSIALISLNSSIAPFETESGLLSCLTRQMPLPGAGCRRSARHFMMMGPIPGTGTA